MKIFLFGVSQVGKSTVGKALSKRLGLLFFDLDFVLMDMFGSIENFQKACRDSKVRNKIKTSIVTNFANVNDDFVMAVSPIYDDSCTRELSDTLINDYCFNLTGSVETIFNRLGYYDENAVLLPDSEEYKNKYKKAVMRRIEIDNMANYNEFCYFYEVNTDDMSVEEVVDKIIEKMENYGE